MDILTNAVPQWVSILFLLAISIAVFMIANVIRQGAINSNFTNAKTRQVYRAVFLVFGIYFSYVTIMSFTGIFAEVTLPPKILLFTALPFLAFLLLVVFNLKPYQTILQNTPMQSLVKLHLFRLIGVFFLINEAYGAIPVRFAYIAGLGDIATALSSLIVARAITGGKPYARPLTIAWNIFGLVDILLVLATAIITTKLAIDTGSQGIEGLAYFPFTLIPAFAPATIIFLHISIFKKLIAESKYSTHSNSYTKAGLAE